MLVLEKDKVSTSSKGFVHQERRQGKEKHRRLLQKDVLVRRRKLWGLNHLFIFNFGNQISSQTTLELKHGGAARFRICQSVLEESNDLILHLRSLGPKD